MKTFFIEALGCALRELDAERIKNWLIANGMSSTLSSNKADYIFFVICGLNKERCEDGIRRIEALKKLKGELIVIGCLSVMHPDMFYKVFSGKEVITKEIEKIDELFPGFLVKFKDVPDANRSFVSSSVDIAQIVRRMSIFSLMSYFQKSIATIAEIQKAIALRRPIRNTEGLVGGIGFDNTYFSLRISNGCSWSCSYCSMKKAIGRLISKPLPVLLDEVRRGIAQERYSFNIISSDSGSYGLDMDPQSTLPQLLSAVLAEDRRIVIEFLQDLNPFFLCKYRKELVELIRTGRIKSTSVPFQSGSERILKLMNRRLDFNEYKAAIKEIRMANHDFKFRTQIIIGFPTETEEDFSRTLEMLTDCKFDEVDVFAYYEDEGISAADIKPKIPVAIISERMNRAKKLLKNTPIRFIANY